MIFFFSFQIEVFVNRKSSFTNFFFVFSQHPKWFVYDCKPIKKCGLLFSFSPPEAKRDVSFGLVIVAG